MVRARSIYYTYRCTVQYINGIRNAWCAHAAQYSRAVHYRYGCTYHHTTVGLVSTVPVSENIFMIRSRNFAVNASTRKPCCYERCTAVPGLRLSSAVQSGQAFA